MILAKLTAAQVSRLTWVGDITNLVSDINDIHVTLNANQTVTLSVLGEMEIVTMSVENYNATLNA